MKLSIVIPNYNGFDLLKKNLPKVLEIVSLENKGETEIVVVDDASTDGSVDYLDSFAKKADKKKAVIKILKNKKNLGFSRSINKAIEQIFSEVFILLNSDVHPEKGFLSPLLKHFEDSAVFAIGCLDKSVEENNVIERGRGLGRFEKGFLIHSAGETTKTNTLWVSGGSGAFRKSIWEKLGGFNELYSPFYWEDIDISYRALKSGFKIEFESQSKVVHEHEKGSIVSSYSSSYIKTIAYKNQFIFIWQNATDSDIILSHIFWMPYHFFAAAIRRDINFFMGFSKALILFFPVMERRAKLSKTFVKTDRDVIREITK